MKIKENRNFKENKKIKIEKLFFFNDSVNEEAKNYKTIVVMRKDLGIVNVKFNGKCR